MLKWHTVTFYCVITVSTDMFYHLDGITQLLAKKKTQWNEDLFFAIKLS